MTGRFCIDVCERQRKSTVLAGAGENLSFLLYFQVFSSFPFVYSFIIILFAAEQPGDGPIFKLTRSTHSVRGLFLVFAPSKHDVLLLARAPVPITFRLWVAARADRDRTELLCLLGGAYNPNI